MGVAIARCSIPVLCFSLFVGGAWGQDSSAPKPEAGEKHEFVLPNFKTESGVTLPQARVVYGTYGRLNAARDNVILLPSHYMADFHGYEWLIGPGHALDTSKLFLVATGYIVFTYLAFGILTLALHDEMVAGDRAATGLALFIGAYWLVRLVIDWFWFGHRIWPRGRRFVVAHIGLELLFAFLAAVYLAVAIRKMIG